MHAVASIDEIERLDAPHLDVVVIALDRLADAPAALEALLEHQRERDSSVLNLRQVTVAATLADLVARADRRTAALARAMQRMTAAKEEVTNAGMCLQRLWPPVGGLGARAIHLVYTPAIGRLDQEHEEINKLLQAVEYPYGPPEPLYIGYNRPRRPPPSYSEESLLRNMNLALQSLRDSNRTVQRRMLRLQMVIDQIEEYKRPPEEEARHAIPTVDPEFRGIASTVVGSTQEMLRQLAAGFDEDGANLLQEHQLVLQDELATFIAFNHGHFSGTMPARSLRDLQVVFDTSAPHRSEIGLPARQVTVSLRGLNKLSHANAVRERVNQGIHQQGWIVEGLNALAMAEDLDARVLALEASLISLLRTHRISYLGHVLSLDAFIGLENQETEISDIVSDGGIIDSAEVRMLTFMVREIVAMARAAAVAQEPNLQIRPKVGMVIAAVALCRIAEVVFCL